MKMSINTSGAGGMQHSTAMHKSHHGGRSGQENVSYDRDSYIKTEGTNKITLYNEKGQIVNK